MKLKLKPSAKINRRYILLEAGKKEVESAILEYLGVLGWAKSSPMFLSNPRGLILAINRKELENVRAAFELSDKKIKIKKVSGTLKGLGK